MICYDAIIRMSPCAPTWSMSSWVMCLPISASTRSLSSSMRISWLWIVADDIKNTVWEGSWQTVSKIQFGRDRGRRRQKYSLGGIVTECVKNTIWEGSWHKALKIQFKRDRGRWRKKYNLGGIVGDGVKNTIWEGSWHKVLKIQFGRDRGR